MAASCRPVRLRFTATTLDYLSQDKSFTVLKLFRLFFPAPDEHKLQNYLCLLQPKPKTVVRPVVETDISSGNSGKGHRGENVFLAGIRKVATNGCTAISQFLTSVRMLEGDMARG